VNRCKRENGSFLYASNFNLGVNILFHLNRKLAAIMNRYDQYNVSISEIHHIHKLDAPSGTAITLADGILKEIDRIRDWSLKTGEKDSIVIEAIRAGTVAGVHEVIYESDFDTLSIRHAARDRRGFAIGAILAAEYIHDKKGIFTMSDVLDL
jgi:4-hydroxy-tetrahydrodipicolinate reductase